MDGLRLRVWIADLQGQVIFQGDYCVPSKDHLDEYLEKASDDAQAPLLNYDNPSWMKVRENAEILRKET